MSDTGDSSQVGDTKFWHRKSCANRIFIGPWDIRATPVSPSLSPEQILPNTYDSSNSSILFDSSMRFLNDQSNASSDSSIKAMHRSSRKESASTSYKSPNSDRSPLDQLVTPSSDGTSFITARSRPNSSIYSSIDSQSHYLEQMAKQQDEDEDEEIDYSILNSGMQIGQPSSSTSPPSPPKDNSDAESTKTIRPNNKGSSPLDASPAQHEDTMAPTATTPPKSPSPLPSIHKKKRKTKYIHRNSNKKPLVWKKAGSVFVSRLPTVVTPEPASIPTGRPIKREPILCMRSAAGCLSNEPTRYKAAKEARYDLLTEKWRQVELVLTSTYLTTYSSSTLFWPKQRLEHRIYLEGSRKPKRLELFLLSALDYSFCLRFQSSSGRTPMVVTMTFKARSFLKCQEWYMQLYHMLPAENKHPMPEWCQVYIPILDLSVNLPLAKKNRAVTMEDVKEAVISILEDEGDMVQRLVHTDKIDRNLSVDDLGLCWTTKDRAEWIYWTHAASDPKKRIDYAICPQNIEQTHRLELRLIEHTPHDIILRENMVLKEPPPVEGFLLRPFDFNGSTNAFSKMKMKMSYFASFDQYLFYIPAGRVSSPNLACFIDDHLLPKNIRAQPYVSAVSPYTSTSTQDIEMGEVLRRMRLMTESKGVIDLTEVSYVRRTFSDDTVDAEEENGISSQLSLSKRSSRSPILPNHSSSQPRRDKHAGRQSIFSNKQSRRKPCLEMIMENGLQIRFEVYSSETCDLWVNYLAQIVVYWKARKEAEKDAHSHDNFLTQPAIESENAFIKTGANTEDGCAHQNEKKVADTRIWSYCLYEQCRDVVKSGILYYKPHKRGTYSQKIFILTANGWILFFDVYNRQSNKKICSHEKKGAIDVAGCYFYSGVDCSKQKKGSNQDNQWKKAARIYSNGLATDDDALSCIFSIWKPKLRRYFSTTKQRLRVYRHDQRLNPNGQTWTFLAKSRREKEEWVCALNTVTEHMIRSENR
ncbi:structural constituent of ribosome [Mucor velutinosus]|uniref:Structural constituent of ribosome n=1 Tax=Mucor velutinosus TaxID=708070 RepID=A0AAN7I0V0_9FUNG|nr:structural constituent of ribosome [Mucor velutinosus]